MALPHSHFSYSGVFSFPKSAFGDRALEPGFSTGAAHWTQLAALSPGRPRGAQPQQSHGFGSGGAFRRRRITDAQVFLIGHEEAPALVFPGPAFSYSFCVLFSHHCSLF